MRGVVLPGNRKVEMRELPVPKPGPGQALLRMRASSLCGSDLRVIYRPEVQGHGPEAYKGVVAGHEPAGEVVEVGPGVTLFAPGDRVAVYHIAGCGECADCRDGWMVSCTSPLRAAYGWQRDGGHADYMLAEVSTLLHLPDRLTFIDGALVACGYGTAFAACLRAEVAPGMTVLVTGLGPVGLAAADLAGAMGARVVGVEVSEERRGLAKDLGMHAVHPDEAEEAVRALQQEGADAAIDCSAAPPARRLTLRATRRWGNVVWVGEGGSVDFEPSPVLIHPQLTLRGSWVCSIGQMRRLLRALDQWDLHPERTVTHRFSLDEAARAYEVFDTGVTGKVTIAWE